MAKWNNDIFYKTPAWLKARRMRLQMDNYICQDCIKTGKVTIANTVHHVQERETHPWLALVLSNLISLCAACHNKRHGQRDKTKRKQEKTSKARIINM